ncbi:MAG: FtsW/RodA/SpoVE family cell cycle protein [Lachnospiraceae bacterium]|nr:FtsW/RodA/SpoVE family cell cycle protein [Lachnospiraceae bacterium]
MLKAIIELSKYILVINILLYTIISYIALKWDDRERKGFLFALQYILIFINHMTGSLVLLSSRQDFTYLFFPVFQMLAVFAYLVLMRAIYPKSDRLILSHMAMLLSISFVILTRLSLTRSVRQFIIVAVSLMIGLVIPALVKNFKLIKSCELIFAAVGIAVLGAVLVSGSLINGSKLSFSIFGLSFQPSEFVKIIYVVFIACMLARAKHFYHILLSAALAAIHVLILAASKDLGSALIYFMAYVILLFVATRKLRYLVMGLIGASAASVASYFMFSHVRVRVEAWLDPWNDINATGYQIAQSLFGIGTGGWFGMGIDSGNPSLIPYVEQDFIFSAICEEYGVIFGICLIAICVNLFLEIVRAAHSCMEPFVKYASYGLGIIYISQLFLTIGGNCKFIPLTGVTLPLISYGGSSVLASVIMFSVVQGFYVNNDVLVEYDGDDEEDDEDAFVPYIPKRYMNSAAGVFAALFACICVYLVHFVCYDSAEVISNSYNAKRQEILASNTIRGDIISLDNETLATTLSDGERYYPYGEVFAHAVGYASNGRMGVEQNANIWLVSSNVSLTGKLQDDLADEKHMGNTVVTTLDAKLQKLAYDALGMYDGAVIITEPSTGKILAMVSKPDFDPNTIGDIWDELISDEDSSVLVNRATQGLYPPGSTFKILTALEYIRENPGSYGNYSFDCTGRFTSGENVISCFHGTKHGTVDFTLSFAKSCNSSFANIALTLDRNGFKNTLEQLYFNTELPVDFTANKSSVSDNITDSDSDMIQTAIGQGETQVTPLHMAMVTAMIANGGEMMQPYLIDYIEAADGGQVKSYSPNSLGKLITEEEADALKSLMSAVIEEGTGTRLQSDLYSAAGKTGSAEYNSSSDSHAWFTGFTYDTDKPLQITVIMEGAGSGGEYAVPVARRILDGYYAE